MKVLLLLCSLPALLLFANSHAEEIRAYVRITPDPRLKDEMVRGELEFTQSQTGGPVTLSGIIYNLKPTSAHGFHVHTEGKIEPNCDAAGPHYNPTNQNHGGPHDSERHVGDLGNIQTDARGVARIKIVDSKISLVGENSIIGRTLVVHANRDDLGRGNTKASLESGNSGQRVACGVILTAWGPSINYSINFFDILDPPSSRFPMFINAKIPYFRPSLPS